MQLFNVFSKVIRERDNGKTGTMARSVTVKALLPFTSWCPAQSAMT